MFVWELEKLNSFKSPELLSACVSAVGRGGQRPPERPSGEAEQRAGRAQQHIWEQVHVQFPHILIGDAETPPPPPPPHAFCWLLIIQSASRPGSTSACDRWRLCCTRSKDRSTPATRTRWRATRTTCWGRSWTSWMEGDWMIQILNPSHLLGI